MPAVVLVEAAEAAQWQNWTRDLGWRVIAPASAPSANIDQRVIALAAQVEAAIRDGSIDPARVYLTARGESAPVVWYAISRVPDLWAAGAVLGGSPKAAIDTHRIFAANFTHVPVLWIGGNEGKALADKLKAAKMNLEWRPASGDTSLGGAAIVEWLSQHHLDAAPAEIDCETNSPNFARCYWIRMTKFDPAERNDVLPSTRLQGGNGAALDLGGFGFQTGAEGPGVLVSYLAEKYNGPLKMGDRIVALDGKPLADAREYVELMEKVTQEKPATVSVQRGNNRIRMETLIGLAPRETGPTARVEAQYLPAEKQIQIVSRTVTEMRVVVQPAWVPATLYWNGLALENLAEPGCWLLSVQMELLHAEKCR